MVSQGTITRGAADDAIEEATKTGRSLGRVLIERGLVSESDLVRILAAQLGMEFVALEDANIDASVATLIPEKVARRYEAIPVEWRDDELVVAMTDPGNVFALDDIRAMVRAPIRPVMATQDGINSALEKFYRLDAEANEMASEAAEDFEADDDLNAIKEVVEDAPIVKLVNLLITQAVQDRASDIHIEPGERDLRVRYRIDGVLHEKMRPPKNIQAGIISRLKIMADINIAERRIPQDGRVNANIGGKSIDLRVATLPTVYGEKIVMRILDKSKTIISLDDLGFLDSSRARFEESFTKPYGTILVTGPTGSGKSTTLYATLNILNDESKNIITVEDPVEYRLAGINQVQVNNKAGMTFAAALRSILRSDPDIVLVGEIRDEETATIAIEAALTGHLVLSTLHTNDASSTPARLIEMGVEPYLVGSALDCIVAQRLSRRLCDKCKMAYKPTEEELRNVGWNLDGIDELPELFRAVGCSSCGKTGYIGRFAIHEVLPISEEIERLVVENAHTEDIKKFAVAQGMLTLRQAGLIHASEGRTSLEEIVRVTV
ncbi:MAG: GspE/PulE family protein [Acidimicrobiia bacterium]